MVGSIVGFLFTCHESQLVNKVVRAHQPLSNRQYFTSKKQNVKSWLWRVFKLDENTVEFFDNLRLRRH